MDVITQRRCLNGLAGSLLLGAIGAGAWALSGLPDPPPPTNVTVQIGVSPENDDSTLSDSSSNPSLLAMKLRGPLEDPRPEPPRQAPPPRVVPPRTVATPKLNFTLLATIIDSQKSLAVIADPSAKSDTKGEGESLDLSPQGVSIVRIEANQVILAHKGQESTIVVDKKRKGGGNPPRNNRGRRP